MGLALGGAGTNRGPADQVGDVLGNNWIQQLCRRGHTLTGQIQQQSARTSEACIDVVRAIQVRIID